MDVDGVVAEIEEIVRAKGLVAYDGQVVTSLRRVGPWEEYFEPSSIDTPLEIPKRRHWGHEQRAFFGVEQPYQMADDEGLFTYSSISTEIANLCLIPGELIAGSSTGPGNAATSPAPCHYAHVMYTTGHRLVRMSCGATHLVLREPVLTTFQQTIVPEEWNHCSGPRAAVTTSRSTWPSSMSRTSRAQHHSPGRRTSGTRLTMNTSSALATPEEFRRAIRGTERDASIFLKDGWHPAPGPRFQPSRS